MNEHYTDNELRTLDSYANNKDQLIDLLFATLTQQQKNSNVRVYGDGIPFELSIYEIYNHYANNKDAK